MKPIKLFFFSVFAYLSLTKIQPVTAADFRVTFKSSNAQGSGYLRFNDLALKPEGNHILRSKNKIKLSELVNLPKINLQFDFDLDVTAFFGYGAENMKFSPHGDPEFVFKFVDGLGYLAGINYTDTVPLSLSSCHYMSCADFKGEFSTTWINDTFYDQGIGTINRYEWQEVESWDPETKELTLDWQLVPVDSFEGYVFGELDGLIDFTTLEAIEAVEAPEPLSILGCGTAIGFGTVFKRHLTQKKKKA